MPLLPSVLQQELLKVMDDTNPQFKGFPETVEDVANNWSNAIDLYAKGVIPASLSAPLAKQAMYGVMLGMNAPLAGLVIFPSAFTAYAVALGSGMQPTFTGVPPPAPINLTPAFAVPFEAPISTRVSVMAGIIDLWFRTGTAINNASGVTTIWA